MRPHYTAVGKGSAGHLREWVSLLSRGGNFQSGVWPNCSFHSSPFWEERGHYRGCCRLVGTCQTLSVDINIQPLVLIVHIGSNTHRYPFTHYEANRFRWLLLLWKLPSAIWLVSSRIWDYHSQCSHSVRMTHFGLLSNISFSKFTTSTIDSLESVFDIFHYISLVYTTRHSLDIVQTWGIWANMGNVLFFFGKAMNNIVLSYLTQRKPSIGYKKKCARLLVRPLWNWGNCHHKRKWTRINDHRN